jgi:hypothetical protein
MDPESNFILVEQLAQARDHVSWNACMAPALAGFPIVMAKFWGLRNDSAPLSTESFSADPRPGLSRGYRASCQCHIAVARRT